MPPDDHQSPMGRATVPDAKLGESGAVTAPVSVTADRKSDPPSCPSTRFEGEITPQRWASCWWTS